MRSTQASPTQKFVEIHGRWRFDGNRAIYLGPAEQALMINPFGVCLYPSSFRSGIATVRVKYPDLSEDQGARILIGYNVGTGSYWSVGLGGYGRAFVIDQFIPSRGWQALRGEGAFSQLTAGRPYDLKVEVLGQRVVLTVDNVRVLQSALPSPLEGNQAGLFAYGRKEVEFIDFHVSSEKPHAFVVMQFGGPFDDLYQEVIGPVLDDMGFDAQRADDVFRPGVIMQDIVQNIIQADVVVAEITPVNANVFYELGYSHAMNKPTILLANRSAERLPFDISGYRVIFYDDSIRGKRDVETSLRRHLESVRRDLGAG